MGVEFDPRITAYFGDAVLRAGFMAIPHLFMRHYRDIGLNAQQAMFLMQVMESTWDLGDPPKTSGDLARRMGVDKRTIRKYSEEVEGLGLLILYDQFDEYGAQVENGYDLGPLFRRLAQFAPEPSPGGSFRRREARAEKSTGEGQGKRSTPPPDQAIRPTPGSSDPPHPRIKRSAPPPDQAIRPVEDQMIRGPGIERSSLKRKTRILKKQEVCILHDTEETADGGQLVTNRMDSVVPGYSLRRQLPLTSQDVHRSDELLQRAGVDNPVRGRIAATLAPGEVWLLRVYAVAKNWPVPLLVSLVYDKATKQPRPASSLLRRYDVIGDQLGKLEQEVAEHVLQCVTAHCPRAPSLVQTDPTIMGASPAMRDVVTALWTMVAEIRGQQASHLMWDQVGVIETDGTVGNGALSIWRDVQAQLAHHVPADEFATWLRDTMLLDLNARQAIVGTANVFARDMIIEHYVDKIRAALATKLQHPIDIHVVVGG